MKIVALIPARSGSKSIPKKNIVLLGGHPLISYSIATAHRSRLIQEVIVTTDSEEIAAIAKHYGASVPFLRPPTISQDGSLDLEFVTHYLDFLNSKGDGCPDLIVHLRPTTPLRAVEIVDAAIQTMIDDPRATALRSMSKTHLTPYKMFSLAGGYAKPFLSLENKAEFYNLPRQAFEDAYIPNGYVDVLRPEVLRATGLLHGDRMKIFETTQVPDIDVFEDFEFAEKALHQDMFKPLIKELEKRHG